MKKQSMLRYAVVSLAYLLTQNSVNAQAIFGSVQGSVTDETGAVVLAFALRSGTWIPAWR
jgi:hypothetical protein